MRPIARKFEIPTTIDEVAELIIGDLPLREKVDLARLEPEHLAAIDDSLGPFINEEFMLFKGNFMLYDDCMRYAEEMNLEAVDASMAVIYRIWQKLKGTHRLRLVKS